MTYGLGPVSRPPRRKQRRLDPNPHFLPDVSAQLPVAEDHLARKVRDIVAGFDVSALDANYSSLGRRGHAPRAVLAVWIYASLIGIHHATKVANATKTDAAFRLLAGGHTISAATLGRFRRGSHAFFQAALQRTVELAVARGLVDPSTLAADRARLPAAAPASSTRTPKHSSRRFETQTPRGTSQGRSERGARRDGR